MPFRETLRCMSFASTTNNKRPSSSRTSSSSSSSTSSSRLPSFEIEGAREDCPTYDAICSSTPMPVQTREHRLDDDFLDAQSEPSTRSYTEDSLEIEIEIEIGNGNGNEIEANDDEELPPYVLLDNGARKPAYSRHEAPSPSPSSSGRRKPEEEQPPQEPSKFDGVLCPRCNIKKAKTWYHERKQKEREARPKSKPNPKSKVNRAPVHYTRADLDNATTFAYYMF
ncbi:hypothetical protein LTR99_001858 [Exophiala xenobiotica]|uniref:Uncharacterized protein n=1 Tax=Vermiconidia calcicola TaxID=1690605 RepID=A0AAV9QAE1_9PEZI|nr:hypothetical protein LTR96_002096 [Exophiala xenobiotica]KAK5531097.1 hypothetical protein LTR23_010143 [Chaetothyriales sp. CCFEE 6169]KAK5536626.1 hypothetical protein LTR25_005300 [Vermiconidia calcicola]KAK5306168.1 hypothetical protein LTR99_001858 [Exophiala xenobiotica]KAK5341852.1 hypothetical protein LTR98_002646 [Exophiala xenobiotica]